MKSLWAFKGPYLNIAQKQSAGYQTLAS